MTTTLEQMMIREHLFRRQISRMFQVPGSVRARRDIRLLEYERDFPAGSRYGHHLGYDDPDWLAEAEQGLDDCANFVTMHAQFNSTDRGLEAEILRKTAELTALLERLRARTDANRARKVD